MMINDLLSSISSGDMLKQYIGIALLGKVKDAQVAQAATLIQDLMPAAPHPNLGKMLDIKV